MILLTGTSGFICKRLLAALLEEYGSEHILALTSKPIDGCNYLLHNAYSFDNDFIIKAGYSISTIIHAGAFTPKSKTEANNSVSCTSNIINTHKLLQLELPELKKFFFLSTLDVYGWDKVISERSPVDPVSLYGYSKLFCEKMIASGANDKHKTFQLLRVGHIYGPGEEAYQKLIPATIRKLLSGQPLEIWGTGDEIRSFLFIDDLISSILKLIKLENDIGTVNLVGGTATTTRELIEMLIEVSNLKASVRLLPILGESRDLVFDNSKMRSVLGDVETPLQHGLRAEWMYMKGLK